MREARCEASCGEERMLIDKKYSDGKLVFTITGDFCADCIQEAEEFINENLEANIDQANKIKFDLDGVGRLTKEAVLLLIATRKKLGSGRQMSVVNVREELYNGLADSGVTTLLEVRKKEQSN